MISELVTQWPPAYSFAFVLVLGLSVVAALIPVSIVSVVQWRKVRQAELDYALRHEMLARGMSAGEIERVLAAGRA